VPGRHDRGEEDEGGGRGAGGGGVAVRAQAAKLQARSQIGAHVGRRPHASSESEASTSNDTESIFVDRLLNPDICI
jgi:hypothetical protein